METFNQIEAITDNGFVMLYDNRIQDFVDSILEVPSTDELDLITSVEVARGYNGIKSVTHDIYEANGECNLISSEEIYNRLTDEA